MTRREHILDAVAGVVVLVGMAALTIAVLFSCGGCAVAPIPGTDSYAAGIRVPSGGVGSADSIGSGAGTILGVITGNPGIGVAAGGLIASALAGLGWGAKKHGDAKAAEARRQGERDGWDEAAGTPAQPAQARPVDPVPVVPVVPVSVAKEAA